MTYEQALTTGGDPFAASYAWLRIRPMEVGERYVLLVIDYATGCATCFSFNKHDWQREIVRVATPGDLAWDSQDMLVSAADKKNTEWECGTLQDMLHYAEGLLR